MVCAIYFYMTGSMVGCLYHHHDKHMSEVLRYCFCTAMSSSDDRNFQLLYSLWNHWGIHGPLIEMSLCSR